MAEPSKVEGIKAASRGLRGGIATELAEPTPRFVEADVQLLKFHGIYQQEDRDERKAQRDTPVPKKFSFMLRTKNPGGFAPSAFYLALSGLADTHANGTLRITTRQGLQLHGIHKSELKDVVASINENLGTTLGACGDINRNVMAPAAPFVTKPYAIARETAHAVAELLTPRTSGYYEIWQDGELAHTTETVPIADAAEPDPLYGTTYLPRKFKIAVAVAGDNSVDIFTQDLGIVPILSDVDVLVGFDLYVGGGLGMTHRKPATFPRLADALGFVEPADLMPVVRAIVEVQRDWGDRTNRKHARLKYTIEDRGLAWFRSEVERYSGIALAPFRELPAWEFRDYLGWHEQGDGRLFLGISIENGRIADNERGALKTALREIVERFGLDLVFTPNHNVLLVDIAREDRSAIDGILATRGVRAIEAISLIERHAMACPALPTCGLALAESERALPGIVDRLEASLASLGLAAEPISIRMTGCPNGCARPQMSEIGLVGVSADRYNLHLGGSTDSTRLNSVYRELVSGADVVPMLESLFADFARERRDGERFGDFCERTVLVASATVSD